MKIFYYLMEYQELTQEEKDIIVDDARYGDLEELESIFSEIPIKQVLEIKQSETNNTTLHMAAGNGHIAIVKYLLTGLDEENANSFINYQNEEGNTALHWATINEQFEVIKFICENYKPDIFIKNKFNHDVLYEAENKNFNEIENYYLTEFNIEDLIKDEEEVEEEMTFSNTDKDYENIEINPGKEIDSITNETLEGLESNEEFIEKTKEMKI